MPDETRRRPRARGTTVKPEQGTHKLERYQEIAASIQPSDLRELLKHPGPTFIKFGQFLGTHPGLLPPRYIAELEDTAAPVPYALIVAVIESELTARLKELFASFEKLPMATAPIGQVHAARLLQSGEEVVVEVQRPLVATEMEFDLALLRELASEAEDPATFGSGHDLKGLVDEYASGLRRELDYVREGQDIERLRADLENEPGIRLPRVHWNYTTRRVIVIERLWGPKWPAWPRWLRRVALGRSLRPAAGGRSLPRSLPEASSAPMWPPFGLPRPGPPMRVPAGIYSGGKP